MKLEVQTAMRGAARRALGRMAAAGSSYFEFATEIALQGAGELRRLNKIGLEADASASNRSEKAARVRVALDQLYRDPWRCC